MSRQIVKVFAIFNFSVKVAVATLSLELSVAAIVGTLMQVFIIGEI
jgi:hypothetical protein